MCFLYWLNIMLCEKEKLCFSLDVLNLNGLLRGLPLWYNWSTFAVNKKIPKDDLVQQFWCLEANVLSWFQFIRMVQNVRSILNVVCFEIVFEDLLWNFILRFSSRLRILRNSQRLCSLERKLAKHQLICENYRDLNREHLEMGHIERIWKSERFLQFFAIYHKMQ